MDDFKLPDASDGWSMEIVRECVRRGIFKEVTFVPDISTHIGFNGLRIWVTAGEEVTVPEPFYAIWADAKRRTLQAYTNARDSAAKRGFAVTMEAGWNGRE